MVNLKEKYLSFINEKTAEHIRISEIYEADDRKDEANLEKIKANISDLFTTLFIIDTKQLEGKNISGYKDINLFSDYLARFDAIPVNWKISLEKAKEHGDTTKQIIEETKLKVAQELKDKLISMFNEEREVNV